MTDKERWIPVTERLPKMTPFLDNPDYPNESPWVLVIPDGGTLPTLGKISETWKTRKTRWVGLSGGRLSVSHWMPLPAPPTAAPKEGK